MPGQGEALFAQGYRSVDPSPQALDEGRGIQGEREVGLLPRPLGDRAALIRQPGRLRPIARPASDLTQEEQQDGKRALVSGVSRPLLQIAQPRFRLARSSDHIDMQAS